MPSRAIAQLIRLLDKERRALISGDLETVIGLTDEKRALADQLESADTVELQALSMKLAQNGRLLAAARDGVSDVATTLKKQREARTKLSGYDRTGKATTITGTPTKTERRF